VLRRTFEQTTGPWPGGQHGHARVQFMLTPVEPVACAYPHHPPRMDKKLFGREIVGGKGTLLHRRLYETEGQAFGIDGDGVIPARTTGGIGIGQCGCSGHVLGARDQSTTGQTPIGSNTAIAIQRQQVVKHQRGPEHRATEQAMSPRGNGQRQWLHPVWCNG